MDKNMQDMWLSIDLRKDVRQTKNKTMYLFPHYTCI